MKRVRGIVTVYYGAARKLADAIAEWIIYHKWVETLEKMSLINKEQGDYQVGCTRMVYGHKAVVRLLARLTITRGLDRKYGVRQMRIPDYGYFDR